MNEQANFATKVLTLHQRLASVKMTLPGSYQLVNPYSGEQKHAVDQITAAFYHKYFNDNHKRRLILGSSPARKGTAITGVPLKMQPSYKQRQVSLWRSSRLSHRQQTSYMM